MSWFTVFKQLTYTPQYVSLLVPIITLLLNTLIMAEVEAKDNPIRELLKYRQLSATIIQKQSTSDSPKSKNTVITQRLTPEPVKVFPDFNDRSYPEQLIPLQTPELPPDENDTIPTIPDEQNRNPVLKKKL